MKHKKLIAIAITFVLAITYASANAPSFNQEVKTETLIVATTTPEIITPPRFSHRQLVWISALEWCESGGNNSAVNWYDKDGTASYYAFQFKPSTLKYFGEKYGIIEKGSTDAKIMELLKVYEVQRAVVESMIEDSTTRWESQFPDCIRKLGRPPRN